MIYLIDGFVELSMKHDRHSLNPCTIILEHILYPENLFCNSGLLTSGLIPSMRHAINSLMADEMVVLPASATVYVQAAEIRVSKVSGVDMTPSNQYRWHSSHLAGTACTHALSLWCKVEASLSSQ